MLTTTHGIVNTTWVEGDETGWYTVWCVCFKTTLKVLLIDSELTVKYYGKSEVATPTEVLTIRFWLPVRMYFRLGHWCLLGIDLFCWPRKSGRMSCTLYIYDVIWDMCLLRFGSLHHSFYFTVCVHRSQKYDRNETSD